MLVAPLIALVAHLAAAAPLEELPPAPEAPPEEGPLLPLAEALAAARSQSPDLEVLKERVVQAQTNLRRAWRQLAPTLNAHGSYTRNRPNQGAEFPGGPVVDLVEVNNLQGDLTLSTSLFNARVFPALKTAEQQIDLATLTLSQTRRELLLTVAAAYLTGAGQRQLLGTSLKQARTTREHARDATVRYEAGTLQRASALRARIDAVRADEEVKRALVAYRESKSQLATLLNRRDTAFELGEPQQPAPLVVGEYQALLDRALADRPEMAAARVNEQIATRLKDDAWAQFLPSLNASAALRYNNSTVFSDQTVTWALTLALTIPLYDGGLRYEALKDADSKTREAKAQTRSQAAKIEDELRRARLDLDSAKALEIEAQAQVRLARENEELVRAQFDAGTATQIEVSDAQTALLVAETDAIQQRLNVQVAGLRLARAVGAFDP